MNAPLIDIGANLTHDSFDNDLEDVLLRAQKEGIEQMIVTGASLEGSRDALALAQRYPGLLFATAGIHPHHAGDTDDEVMAELARLAKHPEVRAIGETGLDFFRNFSPREAQIDSFERHLALAEKLGMPLFLHERDSWPTFGDVLKKWRDRLGAVVVHCFTGEAEALHAYIDMDCHIGITGWIADERRGTHLIELVKDIPANRLMIETDAPYLMPRNIEPKPGTRRNEPAHLTWVCKAVAKALGEAPETVAMRTTENARHFFALEASS